MKHLFYRLPRGKADGAAYEDGWNACGSDAQKHERPNYLTYEEREAFNRGWDDRTEYIASGYENGKAAPHA